MSAVRYIEMDDGCRIACEFDPSDERPVLLLSPSLGTGMALFDAQLERFAKRYSVLRYDPRGHGRSSAPSGSYSLDRLGRDAVALLDALGIKRAHFAGVSLGGMTGQWLGYRSPDRLISLTLAHTAAYMGPPQGWTERIATVREQGMKPMIEPVIKRWFTPRFQIEHPDETARIAAMLGATAPQGYAGCCAAIRDMDMRPILPLIRVPTLIIAGRHDLATPLSQSEELASGIPGAKLTEIDAAHLGNVEQPGEFDHALGEFLELV